MAGRSLKGSKSLANLKDAFAGESQANRRYLYFARVADIEGFPDVAGRFKDTARWRTRRPPSPWTAGRRPRDTACRRRLRCTGGPGPSVG